MAIRNPKKTTEDGPPTAPKQSMQKPSNTWAGPAAPNWWETNSKSMDFIIQRADERLRSTVEYFYRMHERTYQYLGIISPVLGVVIYLFYQAAAQEGSGLSVPETVYFVCLLLVGCAQIGLLATVTKPSRLFDVGEEPQNLAQPEYLYNAPGIDATENEQYINLQIGYLKTMEGMIQSNETLCKGLQSRLNWVLKLTVLSFYLTVAIVIFIAFSFLNLGLA